MVAKSYPTQIPNTHAITDKQDKSASRPIVNALTMTKLTTTH